MSFEKIFDAIQELGKPRDGDLVLFQIENDQWTAGVDTYDDLERQALEYAADKSERGVHISIWREGDANKDEYFRVL